MYVSQDLSFIKVSGYNLPPQFSTAGDLEQMSDKLEAGNIVKIYLNLNCLVLTLLVKSCICFTKNTSYVIELNRVNNRYFVH